MMSIDKITALMWAERIRQKEMSVEEGIQAVFRSIREKDPEINSFISLSEEQALKQAKEVQKQIQGGSLISPIAGVPIAIKDNIMTRGLRTSCASKMLENYIPTDQATVIDRLTAAGAIIVGKTNMDEFAMGSTCETSAFGPCKNPRNTQHVPGGSSGGSCAAVAAGMVPIALGSDTGGSIRQPSSFCGVTGLKPTYGTVSRYGLIAYASSLDQIGPIASSVEDIAAVTDIIRGYDPKDSTSLKFEKESLAKGLTNDVRGLRIGIPVDMLEGKQSKENDRSGANEVAKRVDEIAKVFKEQGAEVEEFELGLVRYAVASYYVIACAEASSNLARFDGVKYGYRSQTDAELHEMYRHSRSEGFGEEVKRRILLGSFVLSSGYYDAYYLKALKAKRLIKEAFDRAFERYDVLLFPASPTTAPTLGESLSDPIQMYLSDINTVAVNLAGLPGISVPCGEDQNGLPIGLQLVGDRFKEKTILDAAICLEKLGVDKAFRRKEASYA